MAVIKYGAFIYVLSVCVNCVFDLYYSAQLMHVPVRRVLPYKLEKLGLIYLTCGSFIGLNSNTCIISNMFINQLKELLFFDKLILIQFITKQIHEIFSE